jgi:glycosyltransferase A (GT-A) superfamily protein (DUF2064 family)
LNNTAVILFCDAAAEARRKRMPRPFVEALHRSVRRRIAGVADLDVIAARELTGASAGLTLAGQIRIALDAAFDRGYEVVILAAGDVPALRASHLLSAAASVRDGRAALSRSRDGGFSLLALDSRPAIEWEAVGLHTTGAADGVIAALETAGVAVILLEELDDLDTPCAAESLLRPLGEALVRRLMALLVIPASSFTLTTTSTDSAHASSDLRAPPMAAHSYSSR